MMAKNLKSKQLRGSSVSRALLAVSLTASLAAAACTTNRTPGAGEPMRDSFIRRSPTSGVSSGSETPLPPPMISSSSQSSRVYVGPDQAAAIMATNQPPKVKVLGISNPGPATSNRVNVGVIASQPGINGTGSVLLGETGELIGSGVTAVTNSDGTTTLVDSAGTVNGTTIANSTVVGTNTGAPLVTGSNGILTTPTTVTASGLNATAASGLGTTVTGSSASLPTVTGASVGTPVAGSSVIGSTAVANRSTSTVGTTNGVPTATNVGTTAGVSATRRLTVGTTSDTAATGVRALRANGRVVVTNVDGSSN
jgi:hypothetical protein